MSWRVAEALDVLLAEVDKMAPNRSKISDGSIGDAAHATRTSDHNPWVIDSNGVGVVRARDFTHDPANGLDCNRLARQLAALLGHHPALSIDAYVIWDRRIISTNRLAEGWREYTGSNGHTHHLHVSVTTRPRGYDSTKPWLTQRYVEFSAATANIKAGLSTSEVLADVRTVLRHLDPDMIGWQEIGGTTRANAMRALLVAKGYRFVRPGGTPDPVAFRRKRFQLVKRYRVALTPATPVGREGAGPATLREKHATVQVLEDRKTGQLVGHLNAHLAPSIHLGGEREELHTAQVAGLAAAGEALKAEFPGIVLVYTFDGNTEDRRRLAPIAALGVRWGAIRRTFGARGIDYVGAAGASPVGAKTVSLNSDHRALGRRFRISPQTSARRRG